MEKDIIKKRIGYWLGKKRTDFIPWNKGKKGVQIAWNKGKKYKVNMSEEKLKERGLKISIAKKLKNFHHSEETKLKISLAKKSSLPWNKGISFRAGIPKPWIREAVKGDKNVNWKGSKVQYRALHNWVEGQLGKPTLCSECGKSGSGHLMHWANISQEYKREITDWKRLCPKCHKKFDLSVKTPTFADSKEMAY